MFAAPITMTSLQILHYTYVHSNKSKIDTFVCAFDKHMLTSLHRYATNGNVCVTL